MPRPTSLHTLAPSALEAATSASYTPTLIAVGHVVVVRLVLLAGTTPQPLMTLPLTPVAHVQVEAPTLR